MKCSNPDCKSKTFKTEDALYAHAMDVSWPILEQNKQARTCLDFLPEPWLTKAREEISTYFLKLDGDEPRCDDRKSTGGSSSIVGGKDVERMERLIPPDEQPLAESFADAYHKVYNKGWEDGYKAGFAMQDIVPKRASGECSRSRSRRR